MEMKSVIALVLSLSLLLTSVVVEVGSQQMYPYVTFFNQTLTNHSYWDATQIGETVDTTLYCITDLSTCCSSSQGVHRGDWYFPDGNRLTFDDHIHERRFVQNVSLRHDGGSIIPNGLYRCDISTIAVHDVTDNSVRDTIYTGLYSDTGGDVSISGVTFTVLSDLNELSPQFTLTCISTDGPATNVYWTRDSVIITEGNFETVLDDAVTAQYTHTLTLVGRLPGLYTCTVSNNKPSTASQSIDLIVGSAPTDLEATRTNPNEIQLSWTLPSPNINTGYIIYYTNTAEGSATDSVIVNGGSVSGYTLSGLSSEADYNVTIAGTANLYSEPVSIVVHGLPPNNPHFTDINSTQTTITLTWSVSSPSAVTEYILSWQKMGCPYDDSTTHRVISTTDLTYSNMITGLQKGSNYSVSVTARNSIGNSTSDSVMVATVGNIPLGAPVDLTLLNVTESSMSFQWGPVPCVHRNGEITGYMINYNQQGYINTSMTENIPISSPDDGGRITISGLTEGVAYNVRVTAVNMYGAGLNESGFSAFTYGCNDCECPSVGIILSSSTTTVALESSRATSTQVVLTSMAMASPIPSAQTTTVLVVQTVTITGSCSQEPQPTATLEGVSCNKDQSMTSPTSNIGTSAGVGVGVAIVIIMLAGVGIVMVVLFRKHRQKQKYSLNDTNKRRMSTAINMAYGMTPANRETMIDEDNEVEYDVVKNPYVEDGSHPPKLPKRQLTVSYEIATPPHIRNLRVQEKEKENREECNKLPNTAIREEEKNDKELYTEVQNDI